MDDILAFITARLDKDEAVAKAVKNPEWEVIESMSGGQVYDLTLIGPETFGISEVAIKFSDIRHIVRHDPARVLRQVAALRRIVEEHKPTLGIVEWPHDQTGKGEALVCPRCQNVENDSQDWHPPVGKAGTFPFETFVTSYVLSPCDTVKAIASIWSDHEAYRREWA